MSGDQADVKRVVKEVMNYSSIRRMISKQEASLLLAELHLNLCSEGIQNVSIAQSKRLRDNSEAGVDKTLVSKYGKRTGRFLNMSLKEYYHAVNNSDIKVQARKGRQVIPHFMGVNGSPKFPVTDSYARHVLTVDRPWLIYPKKMDWKAEFENYRKSTYFPRSARLNYERVMQRYYKNLTHYEAKATRVDHSKNEMSQEDMDTLTLFGLQHNGDVKDYDTALLKRLDRGLTHEWDSPAKVSIVLRVIEVVRLGNAGGRRLRLFRISLPRLAVCTRLV